MFGFRKKLKVSNETRENVRKWLNRFHFAPEEVSRFWNKVETFHKKNDSLPKTNDIIWNILNENRGYYFNEGSIGLYRNATLNMCLLLDIENRHKECLVHACELTALDAAGASNGSWKEVLNPIFNPEFSTITNVSAPYIATSGFLANLSIDEIKNVFITSTDKLYSSFGQSAPSLEPEKAWSMISGKVVEIFASAPKPTKMRVKEPVLSSI